MKLLFWGPPGAGKGTQAKLVADKFGLLHIAPGDIFRQEVREGTELGRLVEGIMAEGKLVPDDITTQIIEKRIKSPEAAEGLVLDGFLGMWRKRKRWPRSWERWAQSLI